MFRDFYGYNWGETTIVISADVVVVVSNMRESQAVGPRTSLSLSTHESTLAYRLRILIQRPLAFCH